MPRVNYVKCARKDRNKGDWGDIRKCGRCGVELGKGSAYKYWQRYRGQRQVRCMEHACRPRPTDLSGAKTAVIDELIEDLDLYKFETIEGVQEAVRGVADTAREVSEEYNESAENMPESFHGTGSHEEMTEKAEELEVWASELECWEIPEFDDSDYNEDLDEDGVGRIADHLEQVIEAADNILGEMPC